jgi:hypothetical protein
MLWIILAILSAYAAYNIFIFLRGWWQDRKEGGVVGFWEYVRDPDAGDGRTDYFAERKAQVAARGKLPPDKLVDQLLMENPDCDFAERAIQEYGPRIAPALVAAIDDPRFLQERPSAGYMRRTIPLLNVLDCLKHYASAEAVPAVAPLVMHKDRDFRNGAALILGASGSDEAIGPLRAALSDEDDYVRSYAMTGILKAVAANLAEPDFKSAMFDAVLMPWSAKAMDLLRNQYAAVGSAAGASLAAVGECLAAAAGRGVEVAALAERYAARADAARAYIEAYRRYCWKVDSVADLRLAPFHLLATEGKVHADRDHVWHMKTLAPLCAADGGVLFATPWLVVDLTDADNRAAGAAWWAERTARGSEGMVVKPIDFVVRGRRGLVQPAVKCRGREYLRIIYGPDYDAPENLTRLRRRGLAAKRSLALREFALGVEGLERFVRGEPLRRVHECTFGVLALESEPVDPRL